MFGVCALCSPAVAESARKPRGSGWVRAIVVTDGAAVYSKPDFDSPVKDYLNYEMPVIVSKRPYAGIGGLGLFHRVRYKKKIGYITDTDIRVTRKDLERVERGGKAPNRMDKAFAPEDETPGTGRAPLYFTRFFGAAVSRVNFTEKFSSRRLMDHMIMYGLRMSGPGTLFDGPPLDFNFWFSLQKPGYYSQFDSGSPTGFMMFGDVMAMLPLISMDDNLVSYGLGVMWTYTKYAVPVKGETFDSQEFRVGVDFGLGYGHRFGHYLLRGDIKYYFEKTQYPGYVLSFQREY